LQHAKNATQICKYNLKMSTLRTIDKGQSVYSLDPRLQKLSNFVKNMLKNERKRFLIENSAHLKHFRALRGKKLWIQVEFMNTGFRTINSDKKRAEN
jgi:hypothetical protein